MNSIKNIDWELLSDQKMTLIRLSMLTELLDEDTVNDLTGILHLLDSIQDEFGPEHLGCPHKNTQTSSRINQPSICKDCGEEL